MHPIPEDDVPVPEPIPPVHDPVQPPSPPKPPTVPPDEDEGDGPPPVRLPGREDGIREIVAGG